MDVEEKPRRPKPPVRTLQGIDHALVFDSSQGPRQQHHIERAVDLAERRQRPDPYVDPCAQRGGNRLVESRDGGWIGIDRGEPGGPAGVTTRQPPVAPPPFKEMKPPPVPEELVERRGFVTPRIETHKA